jgi:hypothetical protein
MACYKDNFTLLLIRGIGSLFNLIREISITINCQYVADHITVDVSRN